MVTYTDVKTGIAKYLDEELMNKVNGWQKWILAATVNRAMEKAANIFNALKAHPVIKMLEIIDSNDMIDIEAIYNAILPEAQKSAATFNMPLLGDITLRADDVEKIYRYIIA